MSVGSGQRGAALVVGLIVLLVLTALALNAMRGSVLGERQAGHARERAVAFEAAEAAVQAGLSGLESRWGPPRTTTWGSGSLVEGCSMIDGDAANACVLPEDLLAAWRSGTLSDHGVTVSAIDGSDLSGLSTGAQPRLIIEWRYIGLGEQENFEVAVQRRGVHLFTVSAVGATEDGEKRVLLQSTIPKVYSW